MKAIVHYEYGAPSDVLKVAETDKPKPEDDEILIRVHAASVHAGDWGIVRGVPYFVRMGTGLRKPKAIVVGTDVAGKVESIGGEVKDFEPGDEVFGVCAGACAEYARARADRMVHKPANVSFEQAAAVPTSALAALHGLRDAGDLKAAKNVLVIGASGGVGPFAAQIAKAPGAQVTGVCSSENIQMALSIGADHVIDYAREDFSQRPERYDLILDVAGNRPLSVSRRALSPKGTLVIVGGRGGPWLMGTGRTLQAMVLSPFVRHALRAFVSMPKKANLVLLAEMLETGKIKPVIERTYPLDETMAAIDYIDQGHARGKLVLTV